MEHMPQELQVWYILPALRREFAECLVKEFDMTQKEAAEELGVTEAAVSQYFRSKRGKGLEFPPEVREKVKEACSEIVGGNTSLTEEIYKLSISEEVKKSMCQVHKELDDKVSETCDMCFRHEEEW